MSKTTSVSPAKIFFIFGVNSLIILSLYFFKVISRLYIYLWQSSSTHFWHRMAHPILERHTNTTYMLIVEPGPTFAQFFSKFSIVKISFGGLISTEAQDSDYILITLWLHSDYILITVWLNSDYILTTYWLHSDYILTTFWLHSGFILATFWLHSG